jgi:hypothetical protein
MPRGIKASLGSNKGINKTGKKYNFECFRERIKLVIKKATGARYVMKLS